MTWFESWSCSKSSTTRRGYTKGYPATRPGRKRAAQPLNPPALRITAGKAIATDCLNCQSLLKWQFAMYRQKQRCRFTSALVKGETLLRLNSLEQYHGDLHATINEQVLDL